MTDDSRVDIEHLKLLLSVITRMAGNSSQMKTWAVLLVTAVFVFSGLSNGPHWLISIGGCIAVVAFWMMDAKYLQIERYYRKLYEAVVDGSPPVKPYELDPKFHSGSIDTSFWHVAWSWSVGVFYIALLIAMLMLFLISMSASI